MPEYFLRTWEKADSVYEGIVLNGEVRLYRFVCGLDDCPSTTQFGDTTYTKEDVLAWLGVGEDHQNWKWLHHPQVQFKKIW